MTGRAEWRWFAAWLPIGVLAGFGTVGILTIGLPLLLLAGGAAAFLLRRVPESAGGWPGLLSGASTAAWLLAWLNRDGPGDVCHAIAGGESCTQEWSPVPFVVVAALMLLGGIALFLALGSGPRRTRRSPPSIPEVPGSSTAAAGPGRRPRA